MQPFQEDFTPLLILSVLLSNCRMQDSLAFVIQQHKAVLSAVFLSNRSPSGFRCREIPIQVFAPPGKAVDQHIRFLQQDIHLWVMLFRSCS